MISNGTSFHGSLHIMISVSHVRNRKEATQYYSRRLKFTWSECLTPKEQMHVKERAVNINI